jgi:hypothetical protein
MTNYQFKFNFDNNKSTVKEIHSDPPEKRSHRRKSALHVRSNNHIYKRAHSELQLLNLLNDEKLKSGYCYDFITSGDIDSLSYLNLTLRTFPKLDHLLFSTWCMAGEDILALFEHIENGNIKSMDAYVGEIFPNSYKVEWKLMNELFEKHKCGRIAVFKNHSKIFAGLSECGQGFSIQTSANINTNPRTENGSINITNESYHFYKDYFDGIKSFV